MLPMRKQSARELARIDWRRARPAAGRTGGTPARVRDRGTSYDGLRARGTWSGSPGPPSRSAGARGSPGSRQRCAGRPRARARRAPGSASTTCVGGVKRNCPSRSNPRHCACRSSARACGAFALTSAVRRAMAKARPGMPSRHLSAEAARCRRARARSRSEARRRSSSRRRRAGARVEPRRRPRAGIRDAGGGLTWTSATWPRARSRSAARTARGSTGRSRRSAAHRGECRTPRPSAPLRRRRR